jgi:hypothetical protein
MPYRLTHKNVLQPLQLLEVLLEEQVLGEVLSLREEVY